MLCPSRRFHVRIAILGAALSICGSAQALEPGLSGEVSYEHLNLPETKYTHLFDSITGLSAKDVNQDGDLDGERFDVSLAARGSFAGVPIIAGVTGYYAHHQDSQTTTCQSSATAFCTRVPFFDPDPTTQQSVAYGDGSNVVSDIAVTANTWGVALEAQTTSVKSSLSGSVDVKGGAGYRRIDTELSLLNRRVSGGAGSPVPGTLGEDYDTGYLGGYLGAVGKVPFGYGLALTFDGDVGLYWAHTDFDGLYTSSGSTLIPTSNITESLTLDHDKTTVIASLKVGIEKDFGMFKASVFGRGEYCSYAPEVKYDDLSSNNGTSIQNGSAWTASVGGRMTVPFGQ